MLSEAVIKQREQLSSAQVDKQKTTLTTEQTIAVEQISSLLTQTGNFLDALPENITTTTNIPAKFKTKSPYSWWHRRAASYKAAQITALFFECEGFETKISRHKEKVRATEYYDIEKTKYIDVTITPSQKTA